MNGAGSLDKVKGGRLWTSSPAYGPDHTNPSIQYEPTNQARTITFADGQFGDFRTVGVSNYVN